MGKPPPPPKKSINYELFVTPPLRTVTPGAKLTFQAHHRLGVWGPNLDRVTWYVLHDDQDVDEQGERHYIRRGRGFIWEFDGLDKVGRYSIIAVIRIAGSNPIDVRIGPYDVNVEKVEAALRREHARAAKKGLADPKSTLHQVEKYWKTLEAAAKKHGVPPAKRKEHDELVEGLKAYTRKLNDLLVDSWSRQRWPINAVHIHDESQTKTRLNVFLSRKKDGTWYLVDWTNPTVRDRTGIHDAKETADDATTAIAAGLGVAGTMVDADELASFLELFRRWESNNRYPDGTLSYVVPPAVLGTEWKGSFKTDGASWWDSVSGFLGWVALGAAAVAIVALAAPVAPAIVVSGATWTAIFSSTAAGIINIGQRHAEGFGNLKDDAFDVLGIAGNCFAAANAWKLGATVVGRATAGRKLVILGQVGTDSVEGVLVTIELAKEYERLEANKTLSPKERTDRLLRLLGSGLVAAISVKSVKSDIANLNRKPKYLTGDDTRPAAKKLEDLADDQKSFDLDELPRAEGHVKDRRQKTTVQEGQARVHHRGKPRPKGKYDPPPPPKPRGMRDADDLDFAAKAKEKGVYILVRDGNAEGVDYIGKPGYAGKPMTMKAKTAQEGPRKGLASFHPEHERTFATLAGEHDPKPTTVAALKADKKEFRRRYDNFKKKKIEGEGFYVDENDHHVVKQVGTDTAYHGDYDLHGVYSKEGKKLDSTPYREELNEEFGADLIQHGAHDEWPDRNNLKKAGQNAGPQPPVTVYMPDGSTVHLSDKKAFKRFYQEHGFDWGAQYGEFERRAGKI